MKAGQQKLTDARKRLNEAKKQLQELESRLPLLKRQLQERTVAVNGLAEKVDRETTAVSQVARQTEERENYVTLVRSDLEQLRQDVRSTLQQIPSQIAEQYSDFETQLQEHTVAIAGAVEQVESDKRIVSQIAQETSDKTATSLEARSELEQLRQDVRSSLQQIPSQIAEQYSGFETQLQEHTVAIAGAVEQVESDKRIVSQIAQETSDKTATSLEARSDLEQLRQDVRSSLQQIPSQIAEQYSGFETQLQEYLIALAGAVEQVESDKRIVSQITAETSGKTATIPQGQAELEELRQEIVSNLQASASEIKEEFRELEKQLQSRALAVEALAAQGETEKTTGSQVVRETSDKTATIIQVRSELEELRGNMATALEEIKRLIEESRRSVETQLQSREVALEELESKIARDKTTVSQPDVETENITATGRQMQAELEQLRQEIVSVANEVGGKEGLEALRREIEEGREVLRQMEMAAAQLQSETPPASPTLTEQIQANLATQEMASRLEQMYSEVAHLAQQVRRDIEALSNASSEGNSASGALKDNGSAIEAKVSDIRQVLDRLGTQLNGTKEELRQNLEKIEQRMGNLRKWLWVATCFCVGLGIALVLALLRR